MFINKTRIALALAVAALLLPAAASASDASLAGYGTPAGVEQVDVAGVTEAPAPKNEVAKSAPAPVKTVRRAEPEAVSQLPFTGFDALLVLGAGGLLLGVGFTLRRLARTARADTAS